jgi:hypothetical protein
VAVAYPPTLDAPDQAQTPDERRCFSRTQLALLALLHGVRNVQDEDDLHCLTFLAGELGILRPSPFYFSRDSVGETLRPRSLILRDTLHGLLGSHDLRWENGVLRPRTELPAGDYEQESVARAVSWLGALTPADRAVFARVTMDLHRRGISVLAHQAEMLFRRGVARLIGGAAGAEASERRLSTVRRQLSLA